MEENESGKGGERTEISELTELPEIANCKSFTVLVLRYFFPLAREWKPGRYSRMVGDLEDLVTKKY